MPVEPVGARSLTIYRNSGDIVLNGESQSLTMEEERRINDSSTEYPAALQCRTLRQDNIRHIRHDIAGNVYVYLPFRLLIPPTCSAAEYIIVITGRELRGHIMRQNIYRATEYDILPLNPDVSVQSPPNAVESHLLALVQSHLQGGTFFFSYGWDITRRLQAQWMTLQEDGDKALWEIVSTVSLGPLQKCQYCFGRQTTGSSGTSACGLGFICNLL